MKKIGLVSGILTLSILFGSVALAASTSATTAKIEKLKTAIEERANINASSTPAERLKSVILNIQKRNLEIASSTKALMQKLLDRKADEKRINILKGYTNVYNALTNLSNKIETKITKMENGGADISASNILLTTAKADINLVNIDMQSLGDGLAKQTSTSTRKAILAELKTQNSKLLSDVKTARADLVNVIISLKPLQTTTSSDEQTGTSSSN